MRGERMEWISEWVQGLAFYLVLMTVVLNLLPDRSYEKYLRLFTGVVFILLVFRPFADLTGIEARMAGAFERITLQNDAELLQREIDGAVDDRMKKLEETYVQAVEMDIGTMAEGTGVEFTEVRVTLKEEQDSEAFGTLESVEITASVPDAAGLSREEEREKRLEANREIGRLRKRIGEYYGLEEGDIKIQLEDE